MFVLRKRREREDQVSAEISVRYTQTSRLVNRAAGKGRRESVVGDKGGGEEEEYDEGGRTRMDETGLLPEEKDMQRGRVMEETIGVVMEG